MRLILSQIKRLRSCLVLLSSLGFLLHSCGSGGGSGSSELAGTLESIEIPVSLKEVEIEDGAGLFLAPGGVESSTFTVALDACSSGLSGNNSVQGILNVYLNDTNCLGKLSSFTLNGQAYIPSGTGSVPFTTWQVGDTATFVGSGASDLMYVEVISQLSSPTVAGDEISYNFKRIVEGTNNATLLVSTASTLAVAGQDAPNFIINAGDISFDNIVPSGPDIGKGQFTFELTCSSGAMTVGNNASYNSYCPTSVAGGTIAGGDPGVDIGAYFSFKLINDINGDGTLTLAQARSTFSAGGDSTITLASDILAGNTGFTTNSLTAPGTLSTTSKMILVLQAKNENASFTSNPDYSSFQYFYIILPTVNP